MRTLTLVLVTLFFANNIIAQVITDSIITVKTDSSAVNIIHNNSSVLQNIADSTNVISAKINSVKDSVTVSVKPDSIIG
ncbi:MAG: hypothetical protein KAG96_02815, partial [Ichthyobacteriaceae bacterium]|nr:hypothetical protein [Ichthyobacteriaceae bacterium]